MLRKFTMYPLLMAALILTGTSARAQDKPPNGYENWGVCPFECCTYREWEADGSITVHKNRSDKSGVVFRLHRGERVDGVDGVVVTEKPGVVTIDRAVQDGYIHGTDKPQLSLQPGELVYMLSPLGEGSYLFWYKGKVYQSGQDLAAMPGVDGKQAKMIWWKLVKNKAGKSGWTSSSMFTKVDGCGA
jgi:hypothetical protein